MDSWQSSAHLSLSEQGDILSARLAHSVVNIMWLNETLQPFMTRDYVLAPFGPPNGSEPFTKGGNWTAKTLKYSVDVSCETPIAWSKGSIPMINSTWGCRFPLPSPRIVADGQNATKTFDTLYVGYYNDDGQADYYLSDGSCPRNESSSFLIQWSKTSNPQAFNGTYAPSAEEQRKNAITTTLFCRSNYYVEEVEATIRLPSNEVIGYQSAGLPEPLASDIFNTSNFEASMNLGHERFLVRKDFPTSNWPSQAAFLIDTSLNLGYLPPMAPFAIGATQLPFEEYLDPKKLARSYQSAYRLLFARQMVSVLSRDLDAESRSAGNWTYTTQSVILVPAFTYVVEALLGASILFAALILYFSKTRISKLHSDPATIAAVMSLSADDAGLLAKLKPMDQVTENELELFIRNRRFRLTPVSSSDHSHRIQLLDLRGDESVDTFNDELLASNRQQTMQSLRDSDQSKAGLVRGLQPTEFKVKMGLAFLAFQVIMFAVIAGLFFKIQKNDGLPLPSSNRFVRQLLENYIPTAVGTFVEPFWVVLNRHLCFLQPFDELRQGRKTGKKSLALEYSSLPPQLTIWKALSNGNILLGVVCTMALLANGLAVSLSGLFFENTVEFSTLSGFTQPYAPKFLALNGQARSFVTRPDQQILTQVGLPLESAYIVASNRTANTPLPPWTDGQLFYFPFTFNSTGNNSSATYRAITPAFGSRVSCQSLSPGSRFTMTGNQKYLTSYSILPTGNLTVSLVQDEGKTIQCVPRRGINSNRILGDSTGPSAYEFAYGLDGDLNSSPSDASFCREHLAAGWVRFTIVNGMLSINETGAAPSIVKSHQETIITCRSMLVAGDADILVSADGHLLTTYSQNTSTANTQEFLTTTPSDLIGQVNQIILDNGMRWHNDSFPSDFLNYLIEQSTNSSAHLDPLLPPPALDEIIPPFSSLYSQLFSTLVGRNMDSLLKSAENPTGLPGYIIEPTIRIYISRSMFILAETILLCYIMVTVILYTRRPWKILCRMPTSLASVIAFMAASHATKDFQETSQLNEKQFRDHLDKMDYRYGFGTFVGTDRNTHVGIEKYPFLAPLTKEDGLACQNSDDSKRSIWNRWRYKITQWKSGKVREGGWM